MDDLERRALDAVYLHLCGAENLLFDAEARYGVALDRVVMARKIVRALLEEGADGQRAALDRWGVAE